MNAEEKSPVLVGIRHHSPAGAYYIRELLWEKRPDCLLIEAPADFSELIHALTDPALKPPFAVMAYTVEAPVRSVLYPFAVYSPEFQAMLAAKELGIELAFCDLPSPYMIGLQLAEEKYYERQSEEEREAAQKEASVLGDTESFWERYLEQSENLSAYLERSRIFGEGAREAAPGERIEQAWNGLREAYMRRIIAEKRAAEEKEGYAACGRRNCIGIIDNFVLVINSRLLFYENYKPWFSFGSGLSRLLAGLLRRHENGCLRGYGRRYYPGSPVHSYE